MNILAFDTCFSACSVAAFAGGTGGVAHEVARMETGHAEALMPMVQRAMAQAGIGFADLGRIVVTYGPGTFTGVRTGVAAARSLALATGAEIVGVSSLRAIAVTQLATGSPPLADALLVAMDARKGQVYAQVVDINGKELTEPLLLDAHGAGALAPGRRLAAVGSGAEAAISSAQSQGREIGAVSGASSRAFDAFPDARHLLEFAEQGSMSAPLVPLYLRPPDAKPQTNKSLPWSTP